MEVQITDGSNMDTAKGNPHPHPQPSKVKVSLLNFVPILATELIFSYPAHGSPKED